MKANHTETKICRRYGALRGAVGRYKKILDNNPRLSSDPARSDLSKLLQRYISSATRTAVDISVMEAEKNTVAKNAIMAKILATMSQMEKIAKQLDALTVNYG